MTKKEFENLVDERVSEKEYAIIEYVYTYHPSISETDGKNQIAVLYRMGRMRIIQDMYHTATVAKDLEGKMMKVKSDYDYLQRRYENLRNGSLDRPHCEVI